MSGRYVSYGKTFGADDNCNSPVCTLSRQEERTVTVLGPVWVHPGHPRRVTRRVTGGRRRSRCHRPDRDPQSVVVTFTGGWKKGRVESGGREKGGWEKGTSRVGGREKWDWGKGTSPVRGWGKGGRKGLGEGGSSGGGGRNGTGGRGRVQSRVWEGVGKGDGRRGGRVEGEGGGREGGDLDIKEYAVS